MNRTDRLLALILELQSSGTQRAEDLARIFETSKRTIYRDMQALCEAGVPVVAVTGQGYSLAEGYFLPPIQFTADEATMLLLGADVMRQSFDAESGAAATDAARKIIGVLPEKLRYRVKAVKESILFFSPTGTAAEIECLEKLRQAIFKQQIISFNYRGRYDEVAKPREVNPYSLANVEGVWYLGGYCYLRQAERNFRLSRIQDLLLLDQTFIVSPEIKRPVCYEQTDSKQVIVRVLFDEIVMRWVYEDRFFHAVSKEPTHNGLLVTLWVRQLEDILPWLGSWGSHVRVLEPDALRQLVIKEAQAVIEQYKI